MVQSKDNAYYADESSSRGSPLPEEIPPNKGENEEEAIDEVTHQRTVRRRDHRKRTPSNRLIQSQGKVTFLQVHDVGTGYGPPDDQIDTEVVVGLDSVPGRRMGFQLRDDKNRTARQGMLNLLRNAYTHDWTVLIDYSIDLTNEKKNGEAIRVALKKD